MGVMRAYCCVALVRATSFPFNLFSMVAYISAFGFDLILVHVFVVALLACVLRFGISLSLIVGIC